MAISSKEEFEALQKNLPEAQKSSYDKYLEAIGISPEDAAMRVAAQEGRSEYKADTVITRDGVPTLVIPAGANKLTENQLRQLRGDTGKVVNAIDQATGKLVLFNPTTGEVFKGEVGDQKGFYNFLNPRATGSAGRLWGGEASGTFTKLPDGSWQIGEAGGETTSAAGFARFLARYGFDTTIVKPGQSIFIGDDGLVQFSGKTYQRGTADQISKLTSKIENAISAGTIATGASSAAGNITQNMGATGNVTTNPFEPGSAAATAWNERRSAYDLLYSEFSKYGLESLVTPLQGLIQQGVSPAEFTIQLRNNPVYQQRFGANQARINKGLRALNEAEYINLEDQYQNIMRQYGLPASYYARGDMGRQEGFEKFIAGDVSPVELEQRISSAYNRVINANPEVGIALRNFYPDITNGDILSYALDPQKALEQINRKITAAEIGGAAVQSGLTTNESDAAYLARYGITKQQAEQGYRTISGYLPRAEQLSSIYGKQVEGGPYTQASAEREVFGVPGAAEEERKRKKITALEQAQFGGSSGLTQGALGRERAGQF